MIVNLDRIPLYTHLGECQFLDISKNANPLKMIRDASMAPMYSTENNNTYYSVNYDLYVIYIHSPKLLDIDLSTIIPAETLSKIYNKEIILTIDYSCEADKSIINDIYTILVIKQNIPPSQILVVLNTPDYKDYIIEKAKSLNLEPIKYECFHTFMKQVQRSFTLEYSDDDGYKKPIIPQMKNPLLKESYSKKFISMNRTFRHHRILLLLMMHKRNLIEHGHISFAKLQAPGQWQSAINQTRRFFSNNEFDYCFENHNEVDAQLPYKVDNVDIVDTKTVTRFQLRHHQLLYSDSYFTMVADTFFTNKEPFHPTEKTFKTMLHKHPFVIVSTPNYLVNLRKLGFKTFDGIIDESYDTELDDQKRMLKIMTELERLCNLSPIELTEFKNKAIPIVEHNFKTLMETNQFSNRIL